jgi:hypothetical protein
MASESAKDPEMGGWQASRKAKRAAGSSSGFKGNQVVDPKGRVVKDFSGHQHRQGNEHGV